MDDKEWLAGRFEDHRAQLRAMAYRMLGSLAEADDAVQDAWERVSRAGADDVENLSGWLTTIVARVCSTCCAPETSDEKIRSRSICPTRSSAGKTLSDPKKSCCSQTRSASPSKLSLTD